MSSPPSPSDGAAPQASDERAPGETAHVATPAADERVPRDGAPSATRAADEHAPRGDAPSATRTTLEHAPRGDAPSATRTTLEHAPRGSAPSATRTTLEHAPRDGAPSATRERILDATLRVVAAEGVGGLSNRRVAAEAGIALGSLTYHFPNQDRLLHDTLVRYVEGEVARLEAIARELRETTPTAEQVAAAIERLLASDPARPGEVAELELHLQASRAPALQEASARCFAAYEEFAAAVLGALAVPSPERHAPAVVALIVGLTTRRLGTGARDAAGTADALMTIVRGARAAED